MKIGLRAGHSPNCRGARGIRDEYDVNKGTFDRLKPVLESYGHTVIDCNSTANTQKQELNEGTNKANTNKCDIYISLHCNAFSGQAHGTEVLVYDNNSTKAIVIGQRACGNFNALGFYNRGIKTRGGELHELRETSMEALIIEMFFCDNQADVNRWSALSWDEVIYSLANAIDPNIPRVKPTEVPKPTNKSITIDELKKMGYTEIKF